MNNTFFLSDYKEKTAEFYEEVKQVLKKGRFERKFDEFAAGYEKGANYNKINAVFIGDFSVGKSAIIRALTGRDDIKIDSDECTDSINYYDYNGFYVTDTPGMESLSEENRKKTKEAEKQADIILHCITPNFFKSNSRSFEEYINNIEDEHKKYKTMLCVNKIDEEVARDDDNKIISIVDMIRNYEDSIEDCIGEDNFEFICDNNRLSFFSAKTYIVGKKENSQTKIDRSQFNTFINKLNSMIEDGRNVINVIEKCRKPVSMINGFLDDIYNELLSNIPDSEQKRILNRKNDYIKKVNEYREKAKIRINDVVTECSHEVERFLFDELDKTPDIIKKQIKEYRSQVPICIRDELDKLDKEYDLKSSHFIDTYDKTQYSADLDRDDNSTKRNNLNKRLDDMAGGLKISLNHINDLANNVIEPQKKGIIFKKIIQSKPGGKGTKLFKLLSKFSKNETAVERVSVNIAKYAKNLSDMIPNIALLAELSYDLYEIRKFSKDRKKAILNAKKMASSNKNDLMTYKNECFQNVDLFCNSLLENANMDTENSEISNIIMLKNKADNMLRVLSIINNTEDD